MINYAGLKSILGDTLPEAHIFFATQATKPYVRSYQDLRKKLGLSSAHTNRSMWKRFVREYSVAEENFDVALINLLPPRLGAIGRFKVTGAKGPITVTVSDNTPRASVANRSDLGAGLWDVVFGNTSTGTTVVTVTDGVETKEMSYDLLPLSFLTNASANPALVPTDTNGNFDTVINITALPANARYNIVPILTESGLEDVTFDTITGRIKGRVDINIPGIGYNVFFADVAMPDSKRGSLLISVPK